MHGPLIDVAMAGSFPWSSGGEIFGEIGAFESLKKINTG